MWQSIQRFARKMQWQLKTLYLASQHPLTPRLLKLLAFLMVAYALSPIDLIPDFIPIIGMLDELILLPIGFYLISKLIPKPVWHACQHQAEQDSRLLPTSKLGAIIIVIIWLIAAAAIGYAAWCYFNLS